MYCIVAVEPEAIENIINGLQQIHPEWQYESCTNAKDLMGFSEKRPPVVMVSRFLPGSNSLTLLKNLPLAFPASQIVLLAGVLNEQTRAFIREAKKIGLEDIVIGKLPGDAPYTLFTALTEAKQNIIKAGEELNLEARKPSPVKKEPIEQNKDSNPATEQPQPRKRRKFYLKREIEPRELVEKTKGKFIIVSSNKGGVGKTTVAITLAIALTQSEIPSVLVDFDLAGPDVKTFFNIKNTPGMESLVGGRLDPSSILVEAQKNLFVLPGPMDKTIPFFEPGELSGIVSRLLTKHPVVIADTPPAFWEKAWLEEIFKQADMVISVVDQSKFSEKETQDYAPKLLMMGVTPEKVRIVLNKFSPKLHNAKIIENHFCKGFRKGIKHLPKVVAVIPEDWDTHVKRGYEGKVVGLDETFSQWHRLAEEIAVLSGYRYEQPVGKPKRRNLFSWGWRS